MRLAVVGAGRIGTLHAETLVGLPGVEEVVVADSDARRAAELADAVGCTAVDAVEAIWTTRLAGVVIASPTATHAALVHAALDANVSVFCEKPLTLSLHESREIATRAKLSGTPVVVGFQRRFDASFRALRDEVRRGRYGEPYVLRIRHADAALPPPGYLASAGTMFVDQCIHDYDAIRWIAGCEVESVSGAGGRLLTSVPEFDLHDDVDTALSLLRLANGALATVEAFRRCPSGYEASATVLGSLATGDTDPDARRRSTIARAGSEPTFVEWFRDAYRAGMETFVDVLEGRLPNPSTPDDATRALEVALAAERSHRERRVVAVDEIA